MRYREESGGQEHSDFSSCFFMLAILLTYVPPGRSGSSSPVPAYSGSNPELQVSGLFRNHR
ncbi:hypothetical protein T06_9467 [Trichinella sp. T6]|nr:hypothetical protein T06_9467 [Trichinella sp. T6]